MSIYYRIWVDAITRLWSKEKTKENWQEKSMITMSLAMTFNFNLIMAILERNILGVYFYKLTIPSLPNIYNSILTLLFLFFLPCIVINYLLIFRGKRYEKLLKKYPSYNGKLFAIYFSVSLLLPIILLWIGILIYQ